MKQDARAARSHGGELKSKARQEGGWRSAEKIREQYSADQIAEWGRQGGQAKVPKGFAKNKALARRMGERRQGSREQVNKDITDDKQVKQD